MSIIIRSLSANLTRDVEILHKMVLLPSPRIPTSRSCSEDTNTKPPSARAEARTPPLVRPSAWCPLVIPTCTCRSGTQI